MPAPSRHKNGRPTKRTKAVLTPLFEAIRIGVPYKLACMAAGITYDCFNKWRQNDPAFDAEVEQAAAQPAVKLFKTIREQAPETWQAGAWSLERRYPEMFANIVATAQAAAIGPQNIIVVGPERAKILATRYEQIRAKSRALVDKVGSSRPAPVCDLGDGNGQNAQASSQPLPEPDKSGPELPDKPAAWWERFVLQGKLIPKADATEALRLVLAELRMSVEVRALEFPTDNVVQTSFCRALEKVTGSDLGWRTMIQIYERQRIRERIWADH